MPDLTVSVLAGFGSAIVVLGVYHFLVAGPRLRSVQSTVGTHDGLLGGGGAEPATRRVADLETSAKSAARELAALTARIDALEKVAQSETPRVGFLRFNAFDDVGSDQSYALALLTRDGDGVVLSSIYSREETRTYGKAVQNFQTSQEASKEERAAIAAAKAATS
ncbi:MAG TPA: DUF4446 family protein [Candidatus Lustribacter sp.]|nr:DUF4446 family protein [Candidatus Lustribacter sp.]